MRVLPSGGKSWRLAYRIGGKQKTIGIGAYPAVTLKEAREARDRAKRMLVRGLDPASVNLLVDEALTNTDAETVTNTFGSLASSYLEKMRRDGRLGETVGKNEWLLGFCKPELWAMPVRDVRSPDVLTVLRRVEARGRLESAGRLRALISRVFRFGIASGEADADPAAAVVGALARVKVTNMAAVLEPKAFGGLLRSLDSYSGAPETIAALQLAALLFPRPGELRAAEWREIDLDRAVWEVPGHKMKRGMPHAVPLSRQAVVILQELRGITGGGDLLFPSARDKRRPISENTLNAALRRLGYSTTEATSHGFRASASTMLNMSGLWSADAIERQLSHVEGNKVRSAYSRGDYWEERVRMMTWWADACDVLKSGGDVPELTRKGAA